MTSLKMMDDFSTLYAFQELIKMKGMEEAMDVFLNATCLDKLFHGLIYHPQGYAHILVNQVMSDIIPVEIFIKAISPFYQKSLPFIRLVNDIPDLRLFLKLKNNFTCYHVNKIVTDSC